MTSVTRVQFKVHCTVDNLILVLLFIPYLLTSELFKENIHVEELFVTPGMPFTSVPDGLITPGS